ncbi:MAG: PorP/SprF family type IX secretion system membrane protein [Bacteroidetes bacterium]|nr:PorP/SprF family type IX secretion system membrane protein [Bacteroidota bacterium]
MKYKLIIIICCLPYAICHMPCAMSQQTPQYTQYMLNNYGLNPAACGISNNKIEVLAGVRRQWVGFPNSPTTSFFNYNMLVGKKASFSRGFHGVGAYWQGDNMGNIIKTDDFYGSYTYHLRLMRFGYIAFGLAAGVRRYGFRITDINDPALNSKNLWLYPDFIPGVKFYNSTWTFDLSVKQLYKYKVKQGGNRVGSPAKLPPHLYFTASRKWWARPHLLVMQSLHLKYNFSSLPSTDYNMLAYLNKNFAVGISYRHLDAVAGIVQFRYDKLVIGIAYDYTIAPYRIGFANSQELMVGLSPSPYYGGSDQGGGHYRTAECPTFQY